MSSFENYSAMETRLADLERKLQEARQQYNLPQTHAMAYPQMLQMPPHMPPSFPMYSEAPTMPNMPPFAQMPGMFSPLPPGVPPDQIKFYLHQQAQMLEQAAQRVRSEQANSQFLDYHKGENSRLLQEMEHARQFVPMNAPQDLGLLRDLKSEVDRLREELAFSQEQRNRLEQQLHEAALRIRRLEEDPQLNNEGTKNLQFSPGPVRAQANTGEHTLQLSESVTQPEPSQNPKVQCSENKRVLESIEQKLFDLSAEKQKMECEYERVRSAPRNEWSQRREEELGLELGILDSNINRLKSKLRSYTSS